MSVQSERALRARIAAHESWARCDDPQARTAPARQAFADRFEKEVDPHGTLPPDERARRAEHARKAYYQRLALKSAASRRKAADARKSATQLDTEADAADAALSDTDSGGGADA